MLINNELFMEAYNLIKNREQKECKIGTLGEKTIHAVLKCYLEPNEEFHEKRIASYYADITREMNKNKIEIIEIQTRSFNALRKKLGCFLIKC